MFEAPQFGRMLPRTKIYMTCYTGFLNPNVHLSWEQEFFEWDENYLSSNLANDQGVPHYIMANSMLKYGILNPIVVWAEQNPGEYNIHPGRTRYFTWRTLNWFDAPIILIDRFSHHKSVHLPYFTDLKYSKEDFVLDLVSSRTHHRDGYQNQHEAWLRSPEEPEMTMFDSERKIFGSEYDLNGLSWRKAKRWHPEQRFPEYFKHLNEKEGIDFYYKGKLKYQWGNNKNRIDVEINDMKDGTDFLYKHIEII